VIVFIILLLLFFSTLPSSSSTMSSSSCILMFFSPHGWRVPKAAHGKSNNSGRWWHKSKKSSAAMRNRWNGHNGSSRCGSRMVYALLTFMISALGPKIRLRTD
jgi:hypothetical protein